MAFDDLGGDSEYCVYHERQLNDSNLCAVHCVNNLLQYPYFDVQTCEHYVQQLKEKERQMLRTGADPNMFVDDSMLTEYVSPDGNYSIEVIKYALATEMFNLSMHRWGTVKGELEKPHELTGFICHFKNHWIALRKLYGQWYDLNSLSGLPETLAIPCTVSDFYLNAHLGTLKEQGYSIFAVTGDYPPLHPKSELSEFEQQVQFNGDFVHTTKIYKASELKSRDKTYPKNLLNDVNRSNFGQSNLGHGGDEELMLQQAMAASLENNNSNNNNSSNTNSTNFDNFGIDSEDAQLQQVLAMSMDSNNNVNNNNNNNNSNNSSNGNGNNGNNDEMEIDETEQMRQAMFMSMQGDFEMKVPSEPDKSDENRIDIQLKLINGKQVQRGFLKTNTLEDVSNYVKSIETIDILENDLKFVSPPVDNFEDLSMVLGDLKSKRIRLIVKVKEKSNNNSNETDDKKENNDTEMTGK